MEQSETSINYQNENSSGGPSASMTNVEGQTTRPIYTVPGILHYLQHEWNRFEIERQQWDTERAELQARIAFLQGERQGQENLKSALVRRIKMLEFALKQERAKFNKFKYGNENVASDEQKINAEEDENKDEANVHFAGNSVTFKQGRQLLRQYLKEIGYVDTIIDIRSTAVKKLLGIKSESDLNADSKPKRVIPNLIKNVNNDFEKSLSSLGFLNDEKIDEDQNEEDFDPQRILIKNSPKNGKTNGPLESLNDFESEEAALHEFDFLSGDGSLTTEKNPTEWQIDPHRINRLKEDYKRDRHVKQHGTTTITNSNSASIRNSLSNHNNEELTNDQLDSIFRNSQNFVQDAPIEGLDELARVTVLNDNELQYETNNSDGSESRKNWTVKFVLRSHLDAIRCSTFHPVESLLITGSEDRTLKLWNLDKAAILRKSNNAAAQDLEPIYTFRRHTGAVLCVAMNSSGEQFYSGGLDSMISVWNLPNPEIDPYDQFDSSVGGKLLEGHTDAVWQLVFSSQKLLSASADGTVRIWDPNLAKPLQSTIESDSIPTSVDWIMQENRQFVVSYENLKTVVFDGETGKIVREFFNENVDSNYRINRLVSHPNQPLVISGHDDRQIRFYDLQSGRIVHSMVAHLDSVSCLSIDPQQNCLVSGSHDRSIRLWHLEKKNCLQEITAHQKKDDESVNDVSFHLTKPFLSSVGADSIAKIYA